MGSLLLFGVLPALVMFITSYELYGKSKGKALPVIMQWVLWVAYPLLLVELLVVLFIIFRD